MDKRLTAPSALAWPVRHRRGGLHGHAWCQPVGVKQFAGGGRLRATHGHPPVGHRATREGSRIAGVARRRFAPVEEHGALAHDLTSLRETMGREVGIMRRNARLARAQRRLDLLAAEVDDTWRRCRPTKDLVELRNMVQVAMLVVADASNQRENRGLHYNADLTDAARESAP